MLNLEQSIFTYLVENSNLFLVFNLVKTYFYNYIGASKLKQHFKISLYVCANVFTICYSENYLCFHYIHKICREINDS